MLKTDTLDSPTATLDSDQVKGYKNRWMQLVIGILCMGLVANLQYGWTLLVEPMESKHHWGTASIQLAFSIFIVIETWLVPIEGWLGDKFGPRPVVAGGAIFAGLGWIMNSYADSLTMLYGSGRWCSGIRCRLRLRYLRRQRAEVVSGPTRPGRRPHGSGVWCRRRGDRDSYREYDR